MVDENLWVRQVITFRSSLNLYDLSKKLKAVAFIREMKVVDAEDSILIKTNMSSKYCRNIIKVLLKEEYDSEFLYQISSEPTLKLSFIDYRKTLRDIKAIEGVVKGLD